MTVQTPTLEQTRNAWESIAPGFDEFMTPQTIRYGEEALGGLDIGPGTRFLDVAAGSGALSIPAARRGAQVVAADIAPTMIERLTARARTEGLANIEGRVMDCHALDFPDDVFDVAASQNGVTMSPNVAAGVAEMVRVTKRGGTVLVVAFGPLAKAEFVGFFLAAVKAALPDFTGGLPMDPPPPPFQLADPDAFRRKLTAAGLADATVDTTTWDMPAESAAHLWNEVTSGHPMVAQLVATLSEAQRRDVLGVLDGTLRERSGGQPGAVLHAEVNIGTGTK
ncbi:MAG: class I SAM-dependent methyltransferase [Streptosporangiales bacterium]